MFSNRRFCVGAPHCRRPTTHPAPSPFYVWALWKTGRVPNSLQYGSRSRSDRQATHSALRGDKEREKRSKEQEQNMGSTDDVYGTLSLPCSAPCVESEKEWCGLEGRCLFIPSLVCFFQALTWSLSKWDAGARSPTVNPHLTRPTMQESNALCQWLPDLPSFECPALSLGLENACTHPFVCAGVGQAWGWRELTQASPRRAYSLPLTLI